MSDEDFNALLFWGTVAALVLVLLVAYRHED